MVKTVSPKAQATPRKPMPVLGKPAASTAAPQPPKTSQNVPTNSAIARVPKDIVRILLEQILLEIVYQGLRWYQENAPEDKKGPAPADGGRSGAGRLARRRQRTKAEKPLDLHPQMQPACHSQLVETNRPHACPATDFRRSRSGLPEI